PQARLFRSGAGHRAALQQVELPVGDGPLDVTSRSVHLLAAVCEVAQLRQPIVVETEPLDELRRDLLLDRPSFGERPNGDLFETRRPFEHLAGAGDAEVVRNDPPGDDGLAETPARLDHALVVARD